jgi:hypothetical protein
LKIEALCYLPKSVSRSSLINTLMGCWLAKPSFRSMCPGFLRRYPSLLTAIEKLLVPDWDTLSMSHIITGWQQAIRAQLAYELEHTDPMSKEVMHVLQDRFAELAEKPKTDNISKLFMLLREKLVRSPEELSRWITCLALVRSWRDEVNTIEQIEEATRGISTL